MEKCEPHLMLVVFNLVACLVCILLSIHFALIYFEFRLRLHIGQ